MLIAKEKNGLHCNDEAFKMATTDALSVASKHIGVAASVYMGQTLGKYDNKSNPIDDIKKEFARIEMHLRAMKDIEISCAGLPANIKIKKGEMIHTENSYKFTDENIESLASGAGLEIQNIFTDKNKWFSLVQLIKN